MPTSVAQASTAIRSELEGNFREMAAPARLPMIPAGTNFARIDQLPPPTNA